MHAPSTRLLIVGCSPRALARARSRDGSRCVRPPWQQRLCFIENIEVHGCGPSGCCSTARQVSAGNPPVVCAAREPGGGMEGRVISLPPRFAHEREKEGATVKAGALKVRGLWACLTEQAVNSSDPAPSVCNQPGTGFPHLSNYLSAGT